MPDQQAGGCFLCDTCFPENISYKWQEKTGFARFPLEMVELHKVCD